MAGINIRIGGSLDPSYKGALSQAEREARATGDRIQKNIIGDSAASTLNNPTAPKNAAGDYVNWWKKAYQEQTAAFIQETELRRVAGNGLGAGAMSGGPGGSGRGGRTKSRGLGGSAAAMGVSVARDSAASLASGARPLTVLLQQLPQLLQALTRIGLTLTVLLPILVAIAAAMTTAFAVNYISKGIAAMVNGLDAIARKGERLEMLRKILHKLVEEMKEAANVKIEMQSAEITGNDKDQQAQAKKRAAELAQYKADLEKKNIAGMKIGNLDNSEADKLSVLQRERENLKEDLKAAEERSQDSPETALLRNQLEDTKAIPFNSKTEADYERLISLPNQIASSEQADKANKDAAVLDAQNKLQENQNAIDRAGVPEQKKEEEKRKAGKYSQSSLERAGIFASASGANSQNLLKEQLTQLKHINENTRGGRRGGSGTRF